MSTSGRDRPHGADEAALLASAQGGDEQAFARLTSPYRRALHVHCYRMLGSVHDADDALQETMIRAWRGLGRFEPRAPLVSWMYRIATNVCLREAERRARDVAGIEAFLSPYPDRLLDELSSAGPGPEAEAEQREGVALSFVASAQLLPPKQRAVLVLRDALGWSAREVADLLGDSVPAVNSALQRARDRLERARSTGELARRHVATADAVRPGLVGRFLEAWEAVDVQAIVALLADDALMTMPPEPMRVVGSQAIGEFFATVPAEGRLDLIRLVLTGANRQPALAAYVQDPADGVFRAYGVMVLALDGGAIAGITGFAGYPDLVTELGLPAELDHDDAQRSLTRDENAEPGTDT